MRVKLVRDHCAAVREAPDRDDQTIGAANSLAGKHMALLLKLHEEADEISRDAQNPVEYADLLEVMLELAKINGVAWDDIEVAMREKHRERGGFHQGMIWTCDVPAKEIITSYPTTGALPHPDSIEGKRRKTRLLPAAGAASDYENSLNHRPTPLTPEPDPRGQVGQLSPEDWAEGSDGRLIRNHGK